MRYRKRSVYFLLTLLLGTATVLSSCSRSPKDQSIELPPTPILTAQTSWAVVDSQRLRLREKPTTSAPALITLWKGYVVEVVKRSRKAEAVGDLSAYWYYINYKGLRGWVYGYYLTMFDSRQRAEQAAKELE